MDRAFTPDRDIPLIVILVAATVILAWGGWVLVTYTPLWLTHITVIFIAMATPLITCPLGHYFAWNLGRERKGYRVMAGVAIAAVACLGFYHTNGSRDTGETLRAGSHVYSHFTRQGKSHRSYGLVLAVDTGVHSDCSTYIGVNKRTWDAIEDGDRVTLLYRTGAWGVSWVVGMERPESGNEVSRES